MALTLLSGRSCEVRCHRPRRGSAQHPEREFLRIELAISTVRSKREGISCCNMETTNREDSRRIWASTRGKDQTLAYRVLVSPIGSACDSANAAPFSVGHEHDRMWARSSSSALGGVERSASQATKIMAPAFSKAPPTATTNAIALNTWGSIGGIPGEL